MAAIFQARLLSLSPFLFLRVLFYTADSSGDSSILPTCHWSDRYPQASMELCGIIYKLQVDALRGQDIFIDFSSFQLNITPLSMDQTP